MEQQVIFRPDQHLKSDDLGNIQTFTRSALDHIVADALNNGRKYVGLAASKTGPTEVTVDVGRYYSGGQVYMRDAQTVFPLLANLPAATQRIGTVVVWGLESEDDIEPRAYLINADTNQFEPREVTMRRTRALQMQIIFGAESPAPSRGTIDSTVIPVCDILLSTAGVVSLTMDPTTALGSLVDALNDIDDVNAWRAQVSQQIDTLRSDLARIANAIPADASSAIRALNDQIDALRKQLRTSASAFWSYVDRFVNTSDSNLAHAGYSARLENGLTFPATAPQKGQISLLNPLETKVITTDNVTLPAWSEVTRLSVKNFGGYTFLSTYPVIALGWRRQHLGRCCVRYGDYLYSTIAPAALGGVVAVVGGASAALNPASPAGLAEIARRPALPYFAISAYAEPYTLDWDYFWKYADPLLLRADPFRRGCRDFYGRAYWPAVYTTGTFNGNCVAQTFLNPNNGWQTSIKLFFRDVAGSGDVQVLICETTNGQPDETKVISKGSVAASAINNSDGGVRIPITPCYLDGGMTYGFIVVTPGNHSLRNTGFSNAYAQGALYYRQDTNKWVTANVNDLCFEIGMAQFAATRSEIQFSPATLVGGMSAIRVMAASHVPPGCSLTWQVQSGGIWQDLADSEADALVGAPALVPLRAVFIGTTDLAPALDLTQSEIEVSLTATSLTHWSDVRTLSQPTTHVQVHYYVTGWDAAHHSLDCAIDVGGALQTGVTPTKTVDPTDPTKVHFVFDFVGISSNSAYAIKTTGGTTAGQGFFTGAERWDFAY